jgi:hypothetical protein
MKLEHRLQTLELKFITKKAGCNPTLFIVIPQELQNSSFDHDSYRPAEDDIEKYLKQLKDIGACRGCEGSCAVDWSPQGFKNHTIGGENHSSSPEPKMSWMFCADAETPVLCRRLINGEREQNI